MIKATELRVGNFAWKDGVIVTIDGRSIMDIQFSESYAEKYSPISLIEEWLLKFGFSKAKRDDPFGGWLSLPRKDFSRLRVRQNLDGIFYWSPSIHSEHINLPHIHTIQNLNFILTGEELTIKP